MSRGILQTTGKDLLGITGGGSSRKHAPCALGSDDPYEKGEIVGGFTGTTKE